MCVVDRQEPPDLLGDRREHLLRRGRLGHQCRHPPQRGLLLRQLTQPRVSGWIAADHRDGEVGTVTYRIHMVTVTPLLAPQQRHQPRQ